MEDLNEKFRRLRNQLNSVGLYIEANVIQAMLNRKISIVSLRKLNLSDRIRYMLRETGETDTVGAVLIGEVQEDDEINVLVIPDSKIDTDPQLGFLREMSTLPLRRDRHGRIRYMCSDEPGTVNPTDFREFAVYEHLRIVRYDVAYPNDVMSKISDVLEKAFKTMGVNINENVYTATVDMFPFSALTGDAKKAVIERERERVYGLLTEDTVFPGILDRFCRLCHVIVDEYNVDEVDYDFDAHVDEDMLYSDWNCNMRDYTDDHIIYMKDLSGKMLYRFLNKDIIPQVQSMKKFYSDKKYRCSNVTVKPDNENLAFSGTTYDWDILKALFAEYRKYGTGWMTYSQLIDGCLCNFFNAWSKFYEWCRSDEAVADALSDSDELYFADGSKVPQCVVDLLDNNLLKRY